MISQVTAPPVQSATGDLRRSAAAGVEPRAISAAPAEASNPVRLSAFIVFSVIDLTPLRAMRLMSCGTKRHRSYRDIEIMSICASGGKGAARRFSGRRPRPSARAAGRVQDWVSLSSTIASRVMPIPAMRPRPVLAVFIAS